MFHPALQADGFETQARESDPAGLNAVSRSLLKVTQGVVHQQSLAALQFGFQVGPQNARRLGPPSLMHHHVFNRYHCVKMPVQTQLLAQGNRIRTRRIGQHDAHTVQCTKTVRHTAVTGA